MKTIVQITIGLVAWLAIVAAFAVVLIVSLS
jgi:hypothetical protein